MPTIAGNHTLNHNLEALRGYAALFVVFCHMLILYPLFNQYYTPTLLIVLSPTGHLWVLVFFVLSGYVIAASSKTNLTRASIGSYIKKRLLRIYPIYIIAIIITLLISTVSYSLFEILMNVAMMQVLVVLPLNENGPAWSLHYEVLYYLLFIPVSFFRLNPVAVLVCALIVAFGNYMFYPNVHTPVISSYLFGFVFWMAGLCITKYGRADNDAVNYNNMVGVLFLLLGLSVILDRAGLTNWIDVIWHALTNHHLAYPHVDILTRTVMSHRDVILLPFCVYAVCVFSGRKFKFHTYLYVLLQVLMIAGIVITLTNFFVSGKHDHIGHFFISVTYYAISLVLPRVKFDLIKKLSVATLKFGAWLGGISYAIYILHFPLIFALGRIPFFNNSALSFSVRLVVFMLVLLGLSYLLEKKLQPWLKKRLT